MSNHPFILPKPVGELLSVLPGYPKTLLFVQTVNLALGDTLRSEVLQPLRGKLISIRVTDAGSGLQRLLAWAARNGTDVSCQHPTARMRCHIMGGSDSLKLHLPPRLFFYSVNGQLSATMIERGL